MDCYSGKKKDLNLLALVLGSSLAAMLILLAMIIS